MEKKLYSFYVNHDIIRIIMKIYDFQIHIGKVKLWVSDEQHRKSSVCEMRESQRKKKMQDTLNLCNL
jgi:hypothetical protein